MADSPSTKRSRINLESRCPSLRKHFSKSASELSCNDCGEQSSPHSSPQRAKSAANPAISGVFQKTHGFFNTLKHRLSRGKSKDRGRQSIDGSFDIKDSDYAADNSSDHSSPATPNTQSPRHRATTIGDSPLARPRLNASLKTDDSHKNISQSMDEEVPTTSFVANEVVQAQVEEPQKRKEATFRQHTFFQLKVNVISGHDLVAMDKSGTSDPYVKFKAGNRMLYKTKTVHKELNPVWEETFTTPIDDPFVPINIKVFDYDWGLQDDFMGSAQLVLTQLELNRPEDVILKLEDPAKPGKRLGELKLNLTLWPKTQEDKEQMEQTEYFPKSFNVSKRFNSISYYQRNPKLAESSRRLKSQIWSSVVTIVLVEAKSLPPETDSGVINEPFVKFRLGNEKYKSKTSYRAKWLEQFDLHLFDEDQMLEVVVCGKYTTHGKCLVDLRSLPRERTLGMWKPLEEGQGEIFLLLTISGTTASETITDLTSYIEDPHEKETIKSRYKLSKTFQNLRDIGHLTVKVFGATGLAAADLGGKSDPFCVLELVNARLQTQTEYKTLTPNWNKIFTFNVKDMSSVLEVTVFDEDRDHKVEFLGRVAIPLLRIRNGEKRWYALKDKNMYGRAKGLNPQILLEMTVIWSPIKGALRVLEPREEKFVQQDNKFKRQIFVKNVTRLKAIIMHVIDFGQFVQSCFEWESPIRSFFALILWVCGCIWFDISTVPAAMLIFLLKNWLVKWLTSGSSASSAADNYDVCSDDEDDDDKEKEEKKTIKERLQAIQEVSQTVQNSIGYLASLGESVKNTFNFSVPELSWLTALLLIAACLVLHYVPIRVLLLLWGLIKFSRRIIRPHTVPNNEILDLLSRVPNDEEVVMFREIPIITNPDVARRDPRKKTKVN